ncbi:hypothetical protein C1T17_04670 [Sphingobium sp. SCG-1]|nr:hypothetical protein C1T17_04670 [Sphingobium sp. SCG-1]
MGSSLAPSRPSQIDRPRLTMRVVGHQEHRDTFIRAPIGFGKTVLLNQCRAQLLQSGKPVQQWSLEPRHRSPDVMRDQLRRLLPDEASTRNATLLLDDWDNVEGSGGAEALQTYLAGSSVDVRLIIAARGDCSLRRARLGEPEGRTTIDSRELAFLPIEQRRVMGTPQFFQLAAPILHLAQGWPVAIHLARAYLQEVRSGADTEMFCRLSDFLPYLESRLPVRRGDLDEVLSALALLKRWDARILQALLPDGKVAALAAVLSMLPIDQLRGSFTTLLTPNPLLHRALQQRFERTPWHNQRTLLRRAAALCIERGRSLEAIELLLRADDREAAADQLMHAGPMRLLMVFGVAPLLEVLREVPANLVGEAPRLQLLSSMISTKQGRQREARLVVNAVAHHQDGPSDSALAPELAFMRAQIAIASHPSSRLSSADFVSPADGLDQSLSAWSHTCLAVLHHQRGDLSQASVELDKTFQAYSDLNADYALTYARLHGAHINLARGRIREASAGFRLVRIDAEERYDFDRLLSIAAKIGRMEAEALYRPNVVLLSDIRTLLTGLHDTDSWFEPYASGYALACAAAFAENGLAGVNEIIAEGTANFSVSDVALLEHFLPLQKAYYALRSGRTLEAHQAWERSGLPMTPEESLFWRERSLGAIVAHGLNLEWPIGSTNPVMSEAVASATRHQRGIDAIRLHLERARIFSCQATSARQLDDVRSGVRGISQFGAWQLVTDYRDIIGPFVDAGSPGLSRPVHRKLVAKLGRSPSPTDLKKLNVQQLQILRGLAAGGTNKELARASDLSADGVKYHLKVLFRRFGVADRAALLEAARQQKCF